MCYGVKDFVKKSVSRVAFKKNVIKVKFPTNLNELFSLRLMKWYQLNKLMCELMSKGVLENGLWKYTNNELMYFILFYFSKFG